jgi:spermidine synthase
MNRYLLIAVFASGMTSLAIEMAASRLLGPAFGTSNLVWASIIGLILIYLTAGYFLGGRWADRSPHARSMYTIMAWAAFSVGLIPLVARPVLLAAASAFDQFQFGVVAGSFAAVLVLFVIPMTLLGTISPFAIRLAIQDPRQAGTIAGRIYAISTLGSFIGTFVSVLILIPLIGTALTFISFGVFLNLVALGGLAASGERSRAFKLGWMPLALVVAGLLLSRGPLKTTEGQIYESESAYNYIEVVERSGYRYLRLNEGAGIHSVWNATVLDYKGPWEQFLVAPFFNPAPFSPKDVKSMAIVGLAAGTVARQATAVYGPIPIDGYEIDPEIIRVGGEYFEMDMPNLNAIAQDGRTGLAHSSSRYTIVAVDAYRPPYIPWHLTTVEFFQVVRDHLTEDGVLAINVGSSPQDRALIEGLVGTISQVFPSVYVMDVPNSFNTMVFATVQPTKVEDFYNNVVGLMNDSSVPPLLLDTAEVTVLGLKPTPSSDIVYTDDHAPIEWVTNSMVLSYVLFGDMEVLK